LGPARRGPRHIKAPWPHGVLVDGPHDALWIGVGSGDQIERLVLGWVDGFSLSPATTEPATLLALLEVMGGIGNSVPPVATESTGWLHRR